MRWDDVTYEPGELKVVASKDGKRWAEDVTRTTGPAAGVVLRPDRDRLRADGADLAFVSVAVVDRDGRTVPRSHDRIHFAVEGPGDIVAVGNGDATDHEPFRRISGGCSTVSAWWSCATKAGGTGAITLRAHADGLKGAETRLSSEFGR